MLRTVLKLFICLFLANSLFSQSRFIRFETDKKDFVRKVNFFNQDGSLIRTFDIDANDPYNNLPYPIVYTSKNGIHTYDVSKIKGNKPEVSKARSNSVLSGVYNDNDKYFAICYNFSNFDESSYNTLGAKSTVFVMDSTGKIMNELKIDSLLSDIHQVIVSRDGKFLFLLYGSDLNIDHNAGAPMQFQIRAISDNSLVTEELFAWKNNEWSKKYPFSANFLTPEATDTYFYLVDWNPNEKKYLYRIYDPNAKKIYVKEMNEILWRVETQPYGFKLKNGKTFYFDRDFQILPMGK